MSESKKYRITGEIRKGRGNIPFSVVFSALKEQQALERLYADMGSRHRARRFEIKVTKITETSEEKAQVKE